MAAQEMQVSQIAEGSPILRRTSVILAVAAALAIGALIGRETATMSKAGTAIRPAAPITLTGWDTTDAARRADVYRVVTAPSAAISLAGWETTDAARRADVYRIVTAETPAFASNGQSITDAQRRAVIYEIATGGGAA